MILTDNDMMSFRDSLISPFSEKAVSNVCYDLSTEGFYDAPGQLHNSFILAPCDSVFVCSKELIHLPNNMVAKVLLRNSRIRQGLSLDAPLYQPGHTTKVFYRVTNVSKQGIQLNTEQGIASILFEELDHTVSNPYQGAFQQEDLFRGMGSYTSAFSKDMINIDEKVNNVKNMEKTIYGNVLSLMAIFIGIFTLVNVNVSLVSTDISMKNLLTFNFATIGSIGFLIALVNTILPSGKYRLAIWLACIISFIAAVLLQIL